MYPLAIVVLGFGLATEVIEGPAPWGLTVVPAVVAAALLGAVVSFLFVARPVEGDPDPASSEKSAGGAVKPA